MTAGDVANLIQMTDWQGTNGDCLGGDVAAKEFEIKVSFKKT